MNVKDIEVGTKYFLFTGDPENRAWAATCVAVGFDTVVVDDGYEFYAEKPDAFLCSVPDTVDTEKYEEIEKRWWQFWRW